MFINIRIYCKEKTKYREIKTSRTISFEVMENLPLRWFSHFNFSKHVKLEKGLFS